MRKLLYMLIACLMLMPARAMAVEGCVLVTVPEVIEDIGGNLKKAWGAGWQNAPDYFGGMYWDNDAEKMCLLLVGGGTEQQRKEIQALAGGDGLYFGSCRYSRRQLAEVMKELESELMTRGSKDKYLVGFGISDSNNNVVANVHRTAPESYIAGLKARYGDMLDIEEGMWEIPMTDAAEGDTIMIPKTGDASLLVLPLLALALLPLLKRLAL